MKKLLLSLSLLASTSAYTQLTTINPDTVCYQTPGSIYSVTNTPGNTYTWTVAAPGVITSGQGTNQIGVNWSAAAPGLIPNAVSVVASNGSGCNSPASNLNVFILQIVPSITALGPFCSTDACVAVTTSPAGGVLTGPGVVGNTFCPQTAGAGTWPLTYTVTQGGCTFTATTSVTVNPTPTLSPISHN
jgi:hypothetical protein